MKEIGQSRRRSATWVSFTGVVLALLGGLTFGPSLAADGQAAVTNVSGVARLAVVKPVRSCADLAKADLSQIGGPGSSITSAAETMTNGVAVCAVEGTLAPSIGFRVELPLATWTQRYVQTGCGGLCGNLRIQVGAADGCPLVRDGNLVTASTDMGHQGMSGDFGRDPQKRADFAYRGVHLTAVTAKMLINSFYGQAPRYSYFTGCSDGGREALVEAERFPQDFDGILAGAPAMNFQVQNSLYHGWQALSNTWANGKAILIASRLPILHKAVLNACDALDGQTDGLIATPGLCRFDPATIICRPGADPDSCFTPAEADVARKFYDGPRDARTGERLAQGGPQYGSELAWAGVYVPFAADQPIFSEKIALDSIPNLILARDAPTKLSDLQFTRATFDRLAERHPLFDATNPDLSAFAKRGGKLILWHGWSDPHISPINTIAYHDALRKLMGASRAESFERLYLLPGVYHCAGGEGPSEIDFLTPMMAWVEGGRAPDGVIAHSQGIASRSTFGQPTGAAASPEAGGRGSPLASPGRPPARVLGPPPDLAPPAGPARSRPVYPYPYIAALLGKGDPDAAGSYGKGKRVPVSVPAWAGTAFYQPYVGVTR